MSYSKPFTFSTAKPFAKFSIRFASDIPASPADLVFSIFAISLLFRPAFFAPSKILAFTKSSDIDISSLDLLQ